jgi:hypothetical protein
MTNKYRKDGKVAVLYSPGFGAGWSTWDHNDIKEELMFDPQLIELILNKDYVTAEKYAQQKWPEIYTGGVHKLEVKWVPEGTKFIITEYDGSEDVITEEDFITA